jgi:hypothetical protein
MLSGARQAPEHKITPVNIQDTVHPIKPLLHLPLGYLSRLSSNVRYL